MRDFRESKRKEESRISLEPKKELEKNENQENVAAVGCLT